VKKHNKNVKALKLSKKKLTQQEYLMYEQIGMVDESQDWLELFTPARISDLFVIMDSCSDNQLKAKQIQKELKDIGFETLGEGTNILTMANPMYPGVCFKIALDDYGLADNHNDSTLEEMVNSKLKKPRYNHVLAKHPSGMVTVQERKVPIYDQDRMDEFRGSIMDTLAILAKDFLIVDLSPNEYPLNYGVERNGDWCFIDASDLYPLENLPTKIRCTKLVSYDNKAKKAIRCGGKLRYTTDFSHVYCPECNGTFLPSEIRPKDKEDKKEMRNAMLDGMTQEEREAMVQKQMVRIGGKLRQISVDVPDPKPENDLPTVENPETIIVKNDENMTTDQFLGRFKKPEAAPENTNDLEEKAAEHDEDEDEVARSGIHEPAAEAVADLEPVSDNPDPVDDSDDDDDEDEPHLVDATGETNDEDPDDSDDNGPDASEEPATAPVDDEDDDDEDIDILYSIETNEASPNWGINMKVVGDPMKALDELVLPLFVWLDDHTYAQAINREQMKNLIRPIIQSMLEDAQ